MNWDRGIKIVGLLLLVAVAGLLVDREMESAAPARVEIRSQYDSVSWRAYVKISLDAGRSREQAAQDADWLLAEEIARRFKVPGHSH